MPFESLKPDSAAKELTSAQQGSSEHDPKDAANTSSEDAESSSNTNGTDHSSANSESLSSNTSYSGDGFLSHNAPQQDILFINGPAEKYTLKRGQEIPEPEGDTEVLIQILAIGLNPVDWKGVDYDFSQPSYPWINGRDFAGVVVRASPNSSSRIKKGDVVFGPSTDYRDTRKAAFQEYVIANEYNVSRVPDSARIEQTAAMGTAFTAAIIALGVNFGLDLSKLSNVPQGPDLLSLVRGCKSDDIPEDVREEVLSGMPLEERPQAGDWIAIWGTGVVGQFMVQLAKLAGLKVACVEDLTTTGKRLTQLGVDFMMDYKEDTDRVVELIREVAGDKLRFGVDTVGKKTAESLQSTLHKPKSGPKSHLVGLSGVPSDPVTGVVHHKQLPIKIFHELPSIGESISKWLEDLLVAKSLTLPEVEVAPGGLAGVNPALDRLRKGEVLGTRLVVPVRDEDTRFQ